MRQLAEKLKNLERKIATAKGPFSLFALFLRENGQDKWDLVASAPWLEKDKKEGMSYLADELRSTLQPDELLSLSRIVLAESDDPGLEAVQRAVKAEHGLVEVTNCNFFSLEIKRAFIITSQRQVDPVVREAS